MPVLLTRTIATVSDTEYQFKNLQPDRIQATITQLGKRIKERFPESSLAQLCEELRGVSLDATSRADDIRKPIIGLRIASALLVAFIILGIVGTVLSLDPKTASPSMSDFIQLLEAGINDIVLIGAGIFFLFTLETRIKRNRALEAIHELRSFAHIIDMHQLTKDITRIETTNSSPLRPMTPGQLERYLDYCSEMLSLVGKVAALYIQHFNETVAIAAVTEVENLTTGLSRKIWQKITLIEHHVDRMQQPDGKAAEEEKAPEQAERVEEERVEEERVEEERVEEERVEEERVEDGESNPKEEVKGESEPEERSEPEEG